MSCMCLAKSAVSLMILNIGLQSVRLIDISHFTPPYSLVETMCRLLSITMQAAIKSCFEERYWLVEAIQYVWTALLLLELLQLLCARRAVGLWCSAVQSLPDVVKLTQVNPHIRNACVLCHLNFTRNFVCPPLSPSSSSQHAASEMGCGQRPWHLFR